MTGGDELDSGGPGRRLGQGSRSKGGRLSCSRAKGTERGDRAGDHWAVGDEGREEGGTAPGGAWPGAVPEMGNGTEMS